jgi:5-hydroxyisourate hydrolase
MSVAMQALDGVYGRPAAGIPAALECCRDGSWQVVAQAETDRRGQIDDWVPDRLDAGSYRIVLASDRYFVGLGVHAAYQQIVVGLRINDPYEVRRVYVVMSPHSYSTTYATCI